MNSPGTITLLRMVTFAGDAAQVVNTDWISWPSVFLEGQLTVIVHSRIGATSLTIQAQAGWDGEQALNTGGGSIVTAGVGIQAPALVTGNLGPLLRLNITFGTGGSIMISAYITPKTA